jgi:hypothetical protein
MSDILERLQYMFFRFGRESPDDAANRRIQTAKDAATEIEKLRAALQWLLNDLEDYPASARPLAAYDNARAALGEKDDAKV